MSSKSKKKSKSSSKTSPASSLSSSFSPATPSTSNRSNTAAENELNEADFALVLEEASRKFPSLIAKTAFIGRLLASDANLASDEMVKKGTTVWVSKSALEASSIKPNSFVSVSLAPLNLSFGTQPLCSILDECAKNLGIARNEEFTDEAGNYFALAIVKPSTELVKSDVLLSPNLLLTIGCPSSGRVVFIYPVHERPLESNLRVHDDAIGCEELHLTLASLTSTSTVDGAPSSNHGDSITNRDDNENGKISSSPRTPLYTKLRPSYGSGKIKTDSFQQKTSVTTNDVMEMLSDDSLRKILQACSVSWLLFRSLLIGNIVFIPLLSRHCGFLVVGAKNLLSDGEHLGEQFAGHLISQHSDRVDNGCVEYYVGKRTKVFLHLPGSSISRSLMENPVQSVHLNGDVTDIKTRDFPKLAGLDKEYEVLKEIIIASSVRGALARMGLRPTKGVLIHGPPGTGKTSLARLCAHDAGVHLFTVNGPEIVTQYYGESERALHDVFDSASKALPSVVFIDELDAIAPARKDGGEELSQRLVATLLNLMDGISRTDGLVVVAATNRPDSIDSALRRPGRLDREIEISVPSPKQRLGILVSILSEMEHTLTDTDIEHLAGATHGFVGADLAALCNEAAMVCLRRYSNINTSFEHSSCNLRSNSYCSNDVVENGFGVEDSEGISEEYIDDLTSSTSRLDVAAETEVNDDRTTKKHALSLSPDDFERARMKVRPSAMREVILEVPKVKWEDIGGQREVKMQLIEAVEWPQKHHEAFKRIGTQPPTGVLLFGPPGCSKTLLARAVASEAGLNFLAVKGPELFSKWVGESEKAVRSLFAKAKANAPSIIFFDEIDGLAVIRGKESDGVSVSDRVMSQLLVELDGLHQRVNVTVIAATNRPDKIDPALLRPGRFDRLLFVGPPDQYDREDIFRVHLKKMPCGSDVSLKELSLLTEGYTGADISLICREAAITAIEEDFNATEITGEHLKAAILKVEPSDVESYDDLSNRFQRLVD